jgi:hypothetical protein
MPGGSAPPRGGRPTGASFLDEDDQTSWTIWWELNKAPFLRLKDAVHAPRAQSGSDEFFLGAARRAEAGDRVELTDSDLDEIVLPALAAALTPDASRDERTAALVALAKAAREPKGTPRRELFARHLREPDQEVRETAALCFGIAGLHAPADVQLLLDLALDTAAGRSACDLARVDDRTRAFAVYALGLLPPALTGYQRLQVLARTAPLLATSSTSRNVKVAATLAIAQFASAAGADGSAADRMLAAAAIAPLAAYWHHELGVGEQLIQAHAPRGIAGLLGPDHPEAGGWRDELVRTLATGAATSAPGWRNNPSSSPPSACSTQSCALSLPQLLHPWQDDDSADAAAGRCLLATCREHKDQQTRSFAALALGFQGGAAARAVLLRELDKADKTRTTPWVALALGVLERRRRDAGGPGADVADDEIGACLCARWREVKNPDTRGALAVALGLCRYRHAADLLLEAAADRGEDALAGYASLGLAMAGEVQAAAAVREAGVRAVRRPLLLQQVSIASVLLGDRTVSERLLAMLADQDCNLARLAAVAKSLGLVGDRRSLPRLAAAARDAGLTALARAFALAALGDIADPRPLPWNTPYAVGVNYRAAAETLRDGTAGILDIL